MTAARAVAQEGRPSGYKTWLWIAGVFLLSRVLLLAIGQMARWGWELHMLANYQWFTNNPVWLQLWAAWDSGWYLRIVEQGYDKSLLQFHADGTLRQLNHAFFPLYPLLTWLLNKLLHNPVAAGVLLSNLCFLGALRLVHQFAEQRWGERSGNLAVTILCFMPHTFIFSAVYTESLFLLLLLGCVLAAHREQWWLAGLLGALLAATRLVGVTVGLGLLWIFWEQRKAAGITGWRIRRYDLRLLWLGLVPMGIVAFAVHLHFHCGDALAFMKAQQGWYRVWHFPLYAIGKSLYLGSLFENVYLAVATSLHLLLAACLVLLRRWEDCLIALPLMLVPLLSGPGDIPLSSMPRYFMIVYPLLGVMIYIARRAPTFARLNFITMVLWNGFLMTAWTTGLHIVI